MFTTASNWSVFEHKRVHYTNLYSISLISILISSSNLQTSSSKLCLSFRVFGRYYAPYAFPIYYIRATTPNPSNRHLSDHCHNIWQTVKIMKLISMQFSPASFYYLHLGCKYRSFSSALYYYTPCSFFLSLFIYFSVWPLLSTHISAEVYCCMWSHSVGPLWTRDRPVAETSNWQHTQETAIHAPGGIRTRNLRKQAAADTRLRMSSHFTSPQSVKITVFCDLMPCSLVEISPDSRLQIPDDRNIYSKHSHFSWIQPNIFTPYVLIKAIWNAYNKVST